MALTPVTPFVGTPAFGKALNSAPRKVKVTFNDGVTMRFNTLNDAEFWAEFTGRTIASVA